jgi:hypothetical protein
MSVKDHGLEVLKKAGVDLEGNKEREYALRVIPTNQPLAPPAGTKAFSVEYGDYTQTFRFYSDEAKTQLVATTVLTYADIRYIQLIGGVTTYV